MYSGKVVKFEQRAFIPVKLLNSGKSGCVRTKVFVCRQKCCIPEKGVVFGQKGLYLAKVVVFG